MCPVTHSYSDKLVLRRIKYLGCAQNFNLTRAPEKRTKSGHQQREANHKGSEKEGEVSRVLLVTNLFPQSSFNTSFSLEFRLRFGKTMTFTFITLKPSRRFIARITFQNVCTLQAISSPIVWNI